MAEVGALRGTAGKDWRATIKDAMDKTGYLIDLNGVVYNDQLTVIGQLRQEGKEWWIETYG